MKNPVPFLILLILFFVLAYIAVLALFPKELPTHREPSGTAYCTDGQTKPCTTGPCNGTSRCIGGAWGGCDWGRICEPGIRVPCVNQGCADSLKTCNECGTGYGPCTGASGS